MREHGLRSHRTAGSHIFLPSSFRPRQAVDAEEEEGCCSGTRQQCRGKTRCGSKADCYDRCLNAGHGIKFCKNACYKMEEEDIIDLYYEIGGFSVYPEDEDFDFYTN